MDCLEGISSEFLLESKWDDWQASLLYSLLSPADDTDNPSFLAT